MCVKKKEKKRKETSGCRYTSQFLFLVKKNHYVTVYFVKYIEKGLYS